MTLVGDPVAVERWGDDRIVIQASFRDKELVKEVPGSKFDAQARAWWVGLAMPACHALRGIFGDRLVIGPQLFDWAAERASWAAQAVSYQTLPDTDGDTRLYPFQRVGAEWLRHSPGALLADEMGVGKTVQACSAIDWLDLPPPILVVCPNSVKKVWADHFATWAPDWDVEIVRGTAVQRRKTLAKLDEGEIDGVIINWEAVRSHSRVAGFGDIRLTDKEKEPGELNRHWTVVIADEVHRAKDPRSKQTRALWAASSDADYRWGLSGTPIANSIEDLWSILHFLDPVGFPTKTTWVDRYALRSWNPFGGLDVVGLRPDTQDELRKTLDVMMLRRLKSQVWDSLPEIVNERRYVTLTPKERKAYEEMRKKLVTELDDGTELVGWNPMTKFQRLVQMASASMKAGPPKLNPDTEIYEDTFLLCEPSSKLDELMDVMEELGDAPVVIVSKSSQMINLVRTRFEAKNILHGVITGEIPDFARDAQIDDFQAGKLRAMLITAGAGSEGITLTRASTMIFLDRPYSKVQDAQTVARIDRFGQTAEKLLVIDLVTEDTVEERVFEILQLKAEDLEEVVRDKDRLREMIR